MYNTKLFCLQIIICRYPLYSFVSFVVFCERTTKTRYLIINLIFSLDSNPFISFALSYSVNKRENDVYHTDGYLPQNKHQDFNFLENS